MRIKSLFLLLVFCLLDGSKALAQVPMDAVKAGENIPSCQLALAMVVDPKDKSAAVLRMTLTNASNQPITYSVSGVIRDFTFTVLDEKGRQPAFTPYGKKMLLHLSPSGNDPSSAGLSSETMNVKMDLLPGKTDVFMVTISDLVDMKAPGTYRVTAIMNTEGSEAFIPGSGRESPQTYVIKPLTVSSNTILIRKDATGYSAERYYNSAKPTLPYKITLKLDDHYTTSETLAPLDVIIKNTSQYFTSFNLSGPPEDYNTIDVSYRKLNSLHWPWILLKSNLPPKRSVISAAHTGTYLKFYNKTIDLNPGQEHTEVLWLALIDTKKLGDYQVRVSMSLPDSTSHPCPETDPFDGSNHALAVVVVLSNTIVFRHTAQGYEARSARSL